MQPVRSLYADEGKQGVEQAVSLQDVAPYNGDGNDAGHDRRVEQRTEEGVQVLGALVECYGERQSNDHGDRQTDEYEDASDTKRMQEALVTEQGDVLVESDEVHVERGTQVAGCDVGERHRHGGDERDQHKYAEDDRERQCKSPCK